MPLPRVRHRNAFTTNERTRASLHSVWSRPLHWIETSGSTMLECQIRPFNELGRDWKLHVKFRNVPPFFTYSYACNRSLRFPGPESAFLSHQITGSSWDRYYDASLPRSWKAEVLRQVLDGGYDAASDNLVAYGKQPEAPGDRIRICRSLQSYKYASGLLLWSSRIRIPLVQLASMVRLTLQRSPFQNRIATGKHLCPTEALLSWLIVCTLPWWKGSVTRTRKKAEIPLTQIRRKILCLLVTMHDHA